ncbi:MAG: hypothetical protein WC822_07465 [Candidatus Paceibacterota bacterium]|jgi:chemotaxis protein CheY-P-specific phosphatase CheC
MLTDKEKKVFQDIAQTGLLETLRTLAKMSGKQWCAFPRAFSFETVAQTRAALPQNEPARFSGDLTLEGATPMHLLCIFPQESALTLMHFLTGHSEKVSDLASMQTLAVAEVSNILANAFLGVIANTLKVQMLPCTPRVLVGSRKQIIEGAISRAKVPPDYALVTELRLESENLTMTGSLCILLDATALANLVTKIHDSPAWTERWRRIF